MYNEPLSEVMRIRLTSGQHRRLSEAAALETALLVRATARPEHIAIAQAAMRRRGIEHLSD